MSLRSAGLDSFAVVDAGGGEIIGTVDAARAHSTVHPGAVYLHMGQAYEVEELDLQNRPRGRAHVQRRLVHAAEEGERHLHRAGARPALGARVELSFGIVSVTEEVVAFQKKRVADNEILDLLPLELPQQHFVTQALWYELPEPLLREEFPLDVLQGSIHAAEHGQIAVLPLIAMCDRWDIGGLSTGLPPSDRPADDLHLRRPPGRRGHHAHRLHELRALVADARRLIDECPCRSGLPVLRAVAEVRQPERAAEQERRARADDADAGELSRPRGAT